VANYNEKEFYMDVKMVDEPGYFFNKNNKQMSNIQKTA
jgi:GTP-binding protein EngB required for normal cell division